MQTAFEHGSFAAMLQGIHFLSWIYSFFMLNSNSIVANSFRVCMIMYFVIYFNGIIDYVLNSIIKKIQKYM